MLIHDVPGDLLGHIALQGESEETQKRQKKTSAIRVWPVPQNIKDVRAFLGFTEYYRRF